MGRRTVGFVEATVRDRDDDTVEVQWVRDSAYRFFPLVLYPELGLMLHPFDLATNKVLALVGRVAARDWIDILTCHERLSPFGCLAWAASGKDPGMSPLFIVEEAARTTHYPAVELDAVVFDGPPPDRTALVMTWRHALADARAIVELLPPEEVGKAVLDANGRPFSGDRDARREPSLQTNCRSTRARSVEPFQWYARRTMRDPRTPAPARAPPSLRRTVSVWR